MQEKFTENLSVAAKSIQIADHMTYITFPLIKEKRLLLRVLSDLNLAVISIINAVLQYEHHHKRIQIYTNARDNFRTFKEIATSYEISPEQLGRLIELVSLNERHKKSPFEFVKNDKIVIMSDGTHSETLTLEKIKGFLIDSKDLLRKANKKMGM
jgi:hypothetical protein